MKLLRKKRFWFVFFIIFTVILSNSLLTFRKSDKEVYAYFEEKESIPEIGYFSTSGISLRYIMAKSYDAELPTILFLHGSPGSSRDFYRYLTDTTLYKKANLITVDRPGYGYSNFGRAKTSITKQAQLLNDVLNSLKAKNILLVGWSYGGPIAVKMALQNTEVKAVLLLAPAVAPEYEKHFVLGYLAKWSATRWFIPKAFRVAEEEKLAHVEELTQMEEDWSKLRIPIIHIHGTNDGLVPYENMSFTKKKIHPEYLKLVPIENGGHLILWKNYKTVQREILEILPKNTMQ